MSAQTNPYDLLRELNGNGANPPAPVLVETEPVVFAPPAAQPKWPELDPIALHGLPGQVARAVDPYTESDQVMTLLTYLVAFGSAVGRSPRFMVGAAAHHLNEFVIFVGKSSRARKGTGHLYPHWIVSQADSEWAKACQGSGMGSGEGLIYRLRDPNGDDPGVTEQRLLITEEELGLTLKVIKRDGSILGEILRKAWDSRRIENMVKRNPLTASNHLISVLGHVTRQDFEANASEVDFFNGLLNRFLIVLVKRSKLLPDVESIPLGVSQPLIDATQARLFEAKKRGQVRRTAAATDLWRAVYETLSKETEGLYGSVTARAEAHVLRLSMLYAMADGAERIDVEHLQAAIALWQYADDSARYLFGDRIGEPVADQILAALRISGQLDQTEVSALFSRHMPAAVINAGLERLHRAGLIRGERQKTGGRPRTTWYLETDEKEEGSRGIPTA